MQQTPDSNLTPQELLNTLAHTIKMMVKTELNKPTAESLSHVHNLNDISKSAWHVVLHDRLEPFIKEVIQLEYHQERLLWLKLFQIANACDHLPLNEKSHEWIYEELKQFLNPLTEVPFDQTQVLDFIANHYKLTNGQLTALKLRLRLLKPEDDWLDQLTLLLQRQIEYSRFNRANIYYVSSHHLALLLGNSNVNEFLLQFNKPFSRDAHGIDARFVNLQSQIPSWLAQRGVHVDAFMAEELKRKLHALNVAAQAAKEKYNFEDALKAIYAMLVSIIEYRTKHPDIGTEL